MLNGARDLIQGLPSCSLKLYANHRDQGQTTAVCLSETRRETAWRGAAADTAASGIDRSGGSAFEETGIPCATPGAHHAAHATRGWPSANPVETAAHQARIARGERSIRDGGRALLRPGQPPPFDRRGRGQRRAVEVDERARGANRGGSQSPRAKARGGVCGPLPRADPWLATAGGKYPSVRPAELSQARAGDAALVLGRPVCVQHIGSAAGAGGVAPPSRVDSREAAIATVGEIGRA